MENGARKEETERGNAGNGNAEHPSHTQVFSIVMGRDPSWQSIIYDLVSSEQLDPWNIDIGFLCKRYFEKVSQLEENNFHVSSKLLLAAALLLRIKSEILLNKYIREIDNVLFGKEEEIKKVIERIELDENEIPLLSPKTPLPRFKKVTLQELIDALDVAIKTESRRIEKEIQKKQAQRLSHVDIPKFRKINIRDRIRHFYAKILTAFKAKKAEIRLPYSSFTGNNKEEKIACFLPMLHLSNTGRLWIEQEKHFSEIWLYLYEVFKKNFPEHDKDLLDSEEAREARKAENELREEIHELKEELDDEQEERAKRVEKLNEDFENPIGDLINEEI
jgi:segregation and condensation protein A